MREAIEAWAKSDEFAEIMQPAPGTPQTRAPMTKPPRMIASSKFVREVRELLDQTRSVEDVADWIIDKMERFGATGAQPVFGMDGTGPCCSWCGVIWPLCGHHHLTQVDLEASDGAS